MTNAWALNEFFLQVNSALFTFVTYDAFYVCLEMRLNRKHSYPLQAWTKSKFYSSFISKENTKYTSGIRSMNLYSFIKFSHLLSYCRHCAPLWQPERANLLKSVWCEIKWRHSAFISFSSLPVWGAAAANFLRHTLSWHHRRILFPIITSSTNFLPHNFAD